MRYTAFLLLGMVLIVLQGEAYHFLGPLAAKGFRPSLLIPLLVFIGVTETNLALGACVAFLLGYVLDVVSGAPIGLYTFSSVAVLALSRVAGVRIVTQGGIARALLAGAFAALAAVIVLVLLAIFGKSPWVPRSLARTILPHAVATIAFAPLVFRVATRVQMALGGFLDPARVEGGKKLRGSAATHALDDVAGDRLQQGRGGRAP